MFVVQPDKRTISYVFDDCAQAARFLTPQRCAHLSDLELSRNKNVQHIRRVINKGVLTTTEKGKFYLFQKPGSLYLLSLLVPWGKILSSTVGTKLITKQEREDG